jgi:hypothetical protein
MSNSADFYAANEVFAKSFDKGDKPLPPARQALVLTCAFMIGFSSNMMQHASITSLTPAGGFCSALTSTTSFLQVHGRAPAPREGAGPGGARLLAAGWLQAAPPAQTACCACRCATNPWLAARPALLTGRGACAAPLAHLSGPAVGARALQIGDCHCVRNAGGCASDDALRSIVISQRLLGTKEVGARVHTRARMLGWPAGGPGG